MTDKSRVNSNRLLGMLPLKEARALEPLLEEQSLPVSQSLYEPNKPIEHVYFVTNGVVSLVKKLDDGDIVEIATVGPRA